MLGRVYRYVGITLLVFGLSMSFVFFLPVKEVWFGEKYYRIKGLSTPQQWHKKIQTWNWVEQYSIRWVYPYMLKVHLIKKTPIARMQDDRYVSYDATTFDLKGYDIQVPKMDIQEHHIKKAIVLMGNISGIQSIKEHASGTVEIIFRSTDRVLLPDFNKPEYYDSIVQQARERKKVINCDFRYQQYANCS